MTNEVKVSYSPKRTGLRLKGLYELNHKFLVGNLHFALSALRIVVVGGIANGKVKLLFPSANSMGRFSLELQRWERAGYPADISISMPKLDDSCVITETLGNQLLLTEREVSICDFKKNRFHIGFWLRAEFCTFMEFHLNREFYKFMDGMNEIEGGASTSKRRIDSAVTFTPLQIFQLLIQRMNGIDISKNLIVADGVYSRPPWHLEDGRYYLDCLRKKFAHKSANVSKRMTRAVDRVVGQGPVEDRPGFWKSTNNDKTWTWTNNDKTENTLDPKYSGLRKEFVYHSYNSNVKGRTSSESTRSTWFMREFTLAAVEGNELEGGQDWAICFIFNSQDSSSKKSKKKGLETDDKLEDEAASECTKYGTVTAPHS